MLTSTTNSAGLLVSLEENFAFVLMAAQCTCLSFAFIVPVVGNPGTSVSDKVLRRPYLVTIRCLTAQLSSHIGHLSRIIHRQAAHSFLPQAGGNGQRDRMRLTTPERSYDW